jgi:hypothetical protein
VPTPTPLQPAAARPLLLLEPGVRTAVAPAVRELPRMPSVSVQHPAFAYHPRTNSTICHCLPAALEVVVAQVAGTQVVLPASNSISAATQAHYIGAQHTYHLIRIDSHPRKPLRCPMLCVGMTNRSRHLSTTAIPCRRELCVCHLRTHPCARTCPHPCAQWYCLRKLRQHRPEV